MIRSILLWLLVLLFAIDTVAGVFRDELLLTVLGLVVMVAFVFLHGAQRYGAIGIAIFAAICLAVSNVFENMGVATGFPFGPYHYTDALGPKLLYVPLMIGPAYLSVGYLAWTLSSILVGGVRRNADTLSTFATPFIAAFIMVLWDLAMDPASSTIQKLWIWEKGGGFFGVPLSNYVGWFLTVYVFMQLFAFYLRARGPEVDPPQPKAYSAQAIAMYAIVAINYVLVYRVSASTPVSDATGAVWQSGDIFQTAAITSLLTMAFVVALTALTVARSNTERGEPHER